MCNGWPARSRRARWSPGRGAATSHTSRIRTGSPSCWWRRPRRRRDEPRLERRHPRALPCLLKARAETGRCSPTLGTGAGLRPALRVAPPNADRLGLPPRGEQPSRRDGSSAPCTSDRYGPVQWAAVHEKRDAGSAPAPDAHNARTTWLTTVNEDGSPHVTAVGAVWLDGTYWFQTGNGTRK